MKPALVILAAFAVLGSFSCSRDTKSRYSVAYKAQHESVATIVNGRAIAPAKAPPAVKRAIAAANHISGRPYKWGGGHARLNDSGYDCSGSVSYVLRNAGLLADQMPSRGFLNYGKRGYGDWITIYARNGHVFMDIAGARFDTQGQTRQDGPRWRTIASEWGP
jgi:cell wall-associated NlpC family hydrolase